MIKVKCDICKKELTQTGALLFSPPKKNVVRKYHICRKCFDEIKKRQELY